MPLTPPVWAGKPSKTSHRCSCSRLWTRSDRPVKVLSCCWVFGLIPSRGLPIIHQHFAHTLLSRPSVFLVSRGTSEVIESDEVLATFAFLTDWLRPDTHTHTQLKQHGGYDEKTHAQMKTPAEANTESCWTVCLHDNMNIVFKCLKYCQNTPVRVKVSPMANTAG